MRFLILKMLLISSLNVHALDINIIDLGAKPDGITLNTAIIQKAIDQVSNSGGGKVIIPDGIFLSGSIELKSNVNLFFENNAILLGSTDFHQYRKLKSWKALILAENTDNIQITGNGIIDGQGETLALNIDSLFHKGEINISYTYRRMRPGEGDRPQIINISNSRKVEIRGVEIRNSASWVQTYKKCVDLVIDSIKVNSTTYWNNDGMDIDDCKNVRITNCFVNSADDGICLKSHDPESCNENIYIANCIVRSSASAIKFGTASSGGFKNIKIENIVVYDTYRSAIAIESVDGGHIENVEINNITATNTGNAIFIRLGERRPEYGPGTLKNIKISNVRVEIPFEQPDLYYNLRGPQLPFFHNPFPNSITGIEGHYVENVVIKDVTISHPGRASKSYAYVPLYRLAGVPEARKDYPEFHMFKELPSWGFYVRHVKGLTFENVNLEVREADFRPALVFDDVSQLKILNVELSSDDKAEQVVFWKVTDYEMKGTTHLGQKVESPLILKDVIQDRKQ